VLTILVGAPPAGSPGPVVNNLYDITSPPHSSGNRTFRGTVDAAPAYMFR
jgi:hypothetical protein